MRKSLLASLVSELKGVSLVASLRWQGSSAAAQQASDSTPQHTTNSSSETASSTGAATSHQPAYKSNRQGKGAGYTKPSQAGGPTLSSCAEDVGPVSAKPLTALQRRMLEKEKKAAFVLLPNAVYRVKALLEGYEALSKDGKAKKPIGIRIGVKKRGCSGYSYTVNYEYEDTIKKKNDTRVDQSDVSIFVDGDALFYVIGTHMDYTTTNVEEKFTFTNPNQKYQCGCGESFMPFDA